MFDDDNFIGFIQKCQRYKSNRLTSLKEIRLLYVLNRFCVCTTHKNHTSIQFNQNQYIVVCVAKFGSCF